MPQDWTRSHRRLGAAAAAVGARVPSTQPGLAATGSSPVGPTSVESRHALTCAAAASLHRSTAPPLLLASSRPHRSQVFLCYGRYTNLELLELYGFLLPENAHDSVPVDPARIADGEHVAGRRANAPQTCCCSDLTMWGAVSFLSMRPPRDPTPVLPPVQEPPGTPGLLSWRSAVPRTCTSAGTAAPRGPCCWPCGQERRPPVGFSRPS